MLDSGMNNIQALMSPEADKIMNEIAKNNGSFGLSQTVSEVSSPVEVKPQYSAQRVAPNTQSLQAGVIKEARDFSYLDGSNMKFEEEKSYQEPTITPEMIKESNFPDFLKQSFLDEPPVQGVLPKDNVDMFAEALIAKGVIPKPQKKAQAPVKQTLTENRSVADTKDQEHYYDYQSSDIKAMLEEIVKKHMNVLYKQLKKDIVSVANQIVDNCAGNSLTTIKIGDNLRFVDGEGNVFEADLHFVGNKKQK